MLIDDPGGKRRREIIHLLRIGLTLVAGAFFFVLLFRCMTATELSVRVSAASNSLEITIRE